MLSKPEIQAALSTSAPLKETPLPEEKKMWRRKIKTRTVRTDLSALRTTDLLLKSNDSLLNASGSLLLANIRGQEARLQNKIRERQGKYDSFLGSAGSDESAGIIDLTIRRFQNELEKIIESSVKEKHENIVKLEQEHENGISEIKNRPLDSDVCEKLINELQITHKEKTAKLKSKIDAETAEAIQHLKTNILPHKVK